MNTTFSFSFPLLPEPTNDSELIRNLYHVVKDPVNSHLGERCEVFNRGDSYTNPAEIVSRVERAYDKTISKDTTAQALIQIKAGLYLLDRLLAYHHVFESVHTLPKIYVFGPLLAKIDAEYLKIYPGKDVVDRLDKQYPAPKNIEEAIAIGAKAQRLLTYLSLQKAFLEGFEVDNHSAILNFYTQEFLKSANLQKKQVTSEVAAFTHSFNDAFDIDPSFMLLISSIFSIHKGKGGAQTLVIDVVSLSEMQIRPILRLIREKMETATGTTRDVYRHLFLLLTNEQASEQFELLADDQDKPSDKAKKQYQIVSRNDKPSGDPLEDLLIIGIICKVEETYKRVAHVSPGADIDLRYHIPQEQRIQQYNALSQVYDIIYRHFYNRIFDSSYLTHAGSGIFNKKKLLVFRSALGLDSAHHQIPDTFADKKKEAVPRKIELIEPNVASSSKLKEKKKLEVAPPTPKKIEKLPPEERPSKASSHLDSPAVPEAPREEAPPEIEDVKPVIATPSYAAVLKTPKPVALESPPAILAQDPAKTEPVLKSFTSTMLYAERVQAWFDDPSNVLSTDPSYVNKGSREQKEAVLFHTFPKAVDDFLDTYGIKSTWEGKDGKKTPHICIPGEIVLENGKTIVGLFTYAFDASTSVCYHRCFTRKNGHDLVKEYVAERHWTVAFPTLETSVQKAKKPHTLVSEDKGYRYRYITPYVLEIDYPVGIMKVRLFQSEIKA